MRKKILFVINTLGRAGAETALITLLKKLPENEYDISLYVLCGQGELVRELPTYVHLLNRHFCGESVLSKKGKFLLFKTVLIKNFCHGAFFHNLSYLFLNRKKTPLEKLLWRIVSDGSERFDTHFDLAVSYIEGGSAYYVHDHVSAAKKAAFIHVDYVQAGYTRRLDKDCYVDFNRIFAVSDETAGVFAGVYPECQQKLSVFHNLIDTEAIRQKALLPAEKSMHEGIRLLTVGRLTPQKGFDYAVYALKLLLEKQYPVYWYIIGEGPEYGRLTQLARSLHVEDHFIFLGMQTNPYPYFKMADFYIHATRFEGKSIAIQEAQVLGCAIAASDCSGNREQIVSGVDGLLCPFSPEGIANAVEYLIEHPQTAESFGREAAQKACHFENDIHMIRDLLYSP